jgi:exoribonuclease-2
MQNHTIDLAARARQAMLDAGFQPDFPAEVLRESQASQITPAAGADPAIRDLRDLQWSSIDNDTSLDLDQIEYVEKLPDGGYKLMVGIADVDSMVPAGSATDHHASTETTSVYLGVKTFPMLPDILSTNRTSLMGGQDRLGVVVELRLTAEGEPTAHDVYRAKLRNYAKLAYNSVGAWLEGKGPIPVPVAVVKGMEAQIRLQAELSDKLMVIRKKHGSLTFSSIEAHPVVKDGVVTEMVEDKPNKARYIIESFMVSANVAMAQLLRERKVPSLRRVVRVPKRWDRIQVIAAGFGTKLPDQPDSRALSVFLDQRLAAAPDKFADLSLSIVKLLGPGIYEVDNPAGTPEGHFGLAVEDYTHSTAPNRRYADLVTQRLLKNSTNGAKSAPDMQNLNAIAARCTERGDASRKVERLMRKIAAACMLVNQIGQTFDGIITGASDKGTYVRLIKVPAEGMLVRGQKGVDVGDHVQVRLVSVDVQKGFIDFERK